MKIKTGTNWHWLNLWGFFVIVVLLKLSSSDFRCAKKTITLLERAVNNNISSGRLNFF